jgi:hypothetical protein
MKLILKHLIVAAIFVLCGILLFRGTVQAASKGESLLNKGDSISVYIDQEDFTAIKAAKSGDKVKIKILDNVTRSGEKLINKGQAVYATLTSRSGGRGWGRGGNMVLAIDSTYSSGKSKVPLKGRVTITGKGAGVMKIVSYVPPIIFFGWLIKGSDVEFPEGKNVFKPVVADDTPVYYER